MGKGFHSKQIFGIFISPETFIHKNKQTHLFNVWPEEFHLSGDCAGNVTKMNFPFFLWSLFTFLLLLMITGTCANELWQRHTRHEFVFLTVSSFLFLCQFVIYPSFLQLIIIRLSYLLSSSFLPPPFLRKVSCHPLHLLQEIVPVGLWTWGFHKLREPTGRPLALLP